MMQQQLTIFDVLKTAREQSEKEQTAREQNSLAAPSESCSLATSKSCSLAPKTKASGWVEVYSPSKRREYKYYRYVYVVKSKVRTIHLRGGDINSPAAQRLKAVVEEAIAFRWPPEQIVAMLTS